jgi:hypothetical protein
MDNSRHTGAWVGACVFTVLAGAELLLAVAGAVATVHRDGLDWQANHEQNTAALHAVLLMSGCVSGGALLALLLTLIPRTTPPSTARRALAVSAGAFLGGFALIIFVVVLLFWALAHAPSPF